ncbi:MAG: alpha/beta hydrolase [Kordiimonadaceae bacterium]|nr:alpha/beta hydrolase [Kordiimonadaceae bacterium]
MWKLLLILVSVGFMLRPASAADTAPMDYLVGINQSEYQFVQSDVLGRGFHIYVNLPEGYASSTKAYPILYLLDGDYTYPMLASYYRYLKFAEEVPDIILVGIAYGADDFKGGNMRGADFTAKAETAAHYGGAPLFQQFFAQELFPLMEGKYRVNPDRRIIFGQSLGGQFALHAALTSPSLFWGHIASNPALHRNLPFFLQTSVPEGGMSKVFVSGSEQDDARFKVPFLKWQKHWLGVEKKPWHFKTTILKGHNHFSAAPAAFRQGLLWLFE